MNINIIGKILINKYYQNLKIHIVSIYNFNLIFSLKKSAISYCILKSLKVCEKFFIYIKINTNIWLLIQIDQKYIMDRKNIEIVIAS